MLIFFLIMLLLFLFFSWYTLGKDIFQPSCLVILSYTAIVVCALMMQPSWQYEYHAITLWIISLGLAVIYFANLIFQKSHFLIGKKNNQNSQVLKATYVPLTVYILAICVQIIAIGLYYQEIIRITGGGVISDVMSIFRSKTAYGTEESVSFLATQFLNVSFAIGIVFLYVFLKNTLFEGIKGNIKYFIPTALYVITSLMTGGRFGTLIIFFAGITMCAILYRKKFSRGFSRKIWVWVFVAVFIVLLGFYWVRELIGRLSVFSEESSFIEYIASYVGGSLPLFDLYLQNPIESSTIFGKETFYALNNTLIELGFLDAEPYITHLEFRIWNGYSLGNVYTGFRRNIQDFGIFGMTILQFLFSAIMSASYNKIKRSGSEYGIILYCSLAYVLYLHGVNDCFYTRVISFGEVVLILLMFFAYSFIIKKRFGRIRLLGNKKIEGKIIKYEENNYNTK